MSSPLIWNGPAPFLEHYPVPGEPPQRIALDPLPFRIGRGTSAHYIIYSRQVSKKHSEIFQVGEEYRIRDLGSTNGTYVNGQRVEEASLAPGDIIHVAHKELKFGCDTGEMNGDSVRSFTEPARGQLPASIIRARMHLREMIENRSIRVVFQPIVAMDNEVPIGFEALGRGAHSALSANPTDLFALADQVCLAAELSRLFRQTAIIDAVPLAGALRLFCNLHPSEMTQECLAAILSELERSGSTLDHLVLEVHEAAVADLGLMRWLREETLRLSVRLAYDDFGAGQSRLQELAEVPPDYIKLDRALIRNIDDSTPRRDLVEGLARVIRGLGIKIIAEGIETREEADACRALGCHFAQGYLFGRPQKLALPVLA